MPLEDYSIRKAEKSETSAIISLIEEHYIDEETVFKSFFNMKNPRMSQEESKQLKENLRSAVLEAMLTNYRSLVAIHEDSQKIVGIVVLTDLYPTNQKIASLDNLISSRILGELMAHIADMYESAKIFEKFPDARKALQLRCLGVHGDHRRMGLSKILLQRGVEYARDNGYDLAHGVFSSIASKKAAGAAGLRSIADFDLRAVRDSEGSAVFADATPNNVISAMARDLKNSD